MPNHGLRQSVAASRATPPDGSQGHRAPADRGSAFCSNGTADRFAPTRIAFFFFVTLEEGFLFPVTAAVGAAGGALLLGGTAVSCTERKPVARWFP
jgi:hypothetical protein